ncbi:MAG: hypothetical protein HYW49_11795 [Deltaproteobacteria bacterium]|nr:hypothetical protein [Deltaproteobacteria bacterium]
MTFKSTTKLTLRSALFLLLFSYHPASANFYCYRNPPGHKHPNGGGYVADTAYVDKYAYIAPGVSVCDRAQIHGAVFVSGFSEITHDAMIVQEGDGEIAITGNVIIRGRAQVRGMVRISGDAEIRGDAKVLDWAHITGAADIGGNVTIKDWALISGNGYFYDKAIISGWAKVTGDADIGGQAQISEHAQVLGPSSIRDTVQINGSARIFGGPVICGELVITRDITGNEDPKTLCKSSGREMSAHHNRAFQTKYL